MRAQSRRRVWVAAESVSGRRDGIGLGRIATGWLKARDGLLDAERERREDADGS